MQKIIIAIDGYSSCGKSTLAKDLAKVLNYKYIDSGAMYRVVTLYCMRHKIINSSENIDFNKLKKELNNINIDVKYNNNLNKSETFLNNENVEEEIRRIDVSNLVSIISKVKFIRKKLVELQQKFGEKKGIVMDGRDIGTVVFPNADLKIFMTADVEIRAKRRYNEYLEKNIEITLKEVVENIKKRDFYDENRKESPLKKADDAIVLDNSNLSIKEQFQFIIDVITEKFKMTNPEYSG